MADDNVARGRESMEGKGGKVGGWKERREGDKGCNKEERERRMKQGVKGDKGVKRKKDEDERKEQ